MRRRTRREKASVKHSDIKYTCLEAGKQMVEIMNHYLSRVISKRIPEENSIVRSCTSLQTNLLFGRVKIYRNNEILL